MGQKRGTTRTPSLKQQKAIDGILEIIRGESNKSIAQVFRDAGYAPASAASWSNIMNSLRPHLQPHLDWLEMHRAQIMLQMDEKIGTASYADLSRSLKTVTEAHQLLGGKPTQRLALPLEDRQRIESMFAPNDHEADERQD